MIVIIFLVNHMDYQPKITPNLKKSGGHTDYQFQKKRHLQLIRGLDGPVVRPLVPRAKSPGFASFFHWIVRNDTAHKL